MPILGTEVDSGGSVELTEKARRQGVYVIGTTGTGKTTLLQNIAYQDMLAGDGLCVLDPHGDFIDQLLLRVPQSRQNDVILFDPGSKEQYANPLGLNLLDCDRDDPKQVDRVSSTIVETLRKLFFYSWGPRMEDLLRHSILTLLAHEGTTFLELLLILASTRHRTKFTKNLKDPVLRHFWQVQFGAYDKRTRVEVVGSSLNKIGRFLANPMMRNIIAQPKSAFDLGEIMAKKKILLVNLSKGDLGEDNSALLGSVLVNMVLVAALQRREIAPAARHPFHLIVDEYQTFATESFPTLQSEARKYGIDVMVAHQYRDQLDNLNRGSTLNVANFITMRTAGIDGMELASQFDNKPPPPEKLMEPVYRPYKEAADGRQLYNLPKSTTGAGALYHEVERIVRLYSDVQAERANQLSNLPNYRALVRLVEGDRLREYELRTMPAQGKLHPEIAVPIRMKSAGLGVPKETIAKQIEKRIGQIAFDPFDEPVEALEKIKAGV